MPSAAGRPRVALICHRGDRIDREGLAAWLATSLDLVGIVLLVDRPGRLFAKVRREIRRVGLAAFLDVLAFRAFYRLALARSDAAWIAQEVARLRALYPARFVDIPRLEAAHPNTPDVRRFLERCRPDFVIARCKYILKPEIFTIPRRGTFILHPGICPEYRNAHGCFWALANRDLARVGMTLLRADKGVDTGPVYLQTTYDFDEGRESHVMIQYRVVLENLDAIRDALITVWKDEGRPISTAGRASAVWGQPRLTAYLRWKRAARRAARRVAA